MHCSINSVVGECHDKRISFIASRAGAACGHRYRGLGSCFPVCDVGGLVRTDPSGGSVMALLLWLYRRQRRGPVFEMGPIPRWRPATAGAPLEQSDPQAVGGPFDSSDVDTLHLHHRLESALGAGRIGVAEKSQKLVRHDLPGEAIAIFNPAALLG